MSKRLKNYPDQLHVIREYGADAASLSDSFAGRAGKSFASEEVKHLRHLLPWWNAYGFFVTYANMMAGIRIRRLPRAVIY